jgi:acyl dehydratase
MISTHPHEHFSAVLSLDPSNTSGFARSVGDTNPLHHDVDYATATRFGRLLASGPQTTAHLLALTASHFSKRGAMLGLEFWVRFRRPIYADETISLEWLVISVKKPSFSAYVVQYQCCGVTRTRPFAPTAVSPFSFRMRPRKSMISPLRRGS